MNEINEGLIYVLDNITFYCVQYLFTIFFYKIPTVLAIRTSPKYCLNSFATKQKLVIKQGSVLNVSDRTNWGQWMYIMFYGRCPLQSNRKKYKIFITLTSFNEHYNETLVVVSLGQYWRVRNRIIFVPKSSVNISAFKCFFLTR